MSLLNASLGVGGGDVQLGDLFAGDRSRVRDSDVHAHCVRVHDNLAQLLGEGGVAESVAEGELHGAGVAGFVPEVVRLVVPVADVDALGVVDEVDAGGVHHLIEGRGVRTRGVGVGCVGVVEGSEVALRGVGEKVVGPGVHRPAGRVDLTGQQFADGSEARLAGPADPHDGVDRHLVDPPEFEDVGKVQQHDHLAELSGDPLEGGDLPIAQLEVVLGRVQIVGVLGAGASDRDHTAVRPLELPELAFLQAVRKVGALAARAGDDHDRRVRELLGLLEDSGGVVLVLGWLWHRPVLRSQVDPGAVLMKVAIEVRELGVVLEPRGLEPGEQVDGRVQVNRARTGTAVDRVHRRPAENIHLATVARQRERVVVILQQDHAFGLNALDQCIARLGQRLTARHRWPEEAVQDRLVGAESQDVEDDCGYRNESDDRAPARDEEALAWFFGSVHCHLHVS